MSEKSETPKLEVPNPMTREFADELARAALRSVHSYTPAVQALNIQRRELWKGAWVLYREALENRLLDEVEAAVKRLFPNAFVKRGTDSSPTQPRPNIVVRLTEAGELHEVFSPYLEAESRATSGYLDASVVTAAMRMRPTHQMFRTWDRVAVRVEPIDVMRGNIGPVAKKLAKWVEPAAQKLIARIEANTKSVAAARSDETLKRELMTLIDAKGCDELKAAKARGDVAVGDGRVVVTVGAVTVKAFATERWPLHAEPTVARFNSTLPKLTALTDAATLADVSIRSPY